MRPIASAQSAHRFPLNDLFGAESRVRILRVLAELERPLSTTDIAERAELTSPGARRALGSLVQTGLVVPSGDSRRRQYSLSDDGPLVREILQLFASERRRSSDLLKKLRAAVHQLSPPPTMAWTPGFPNRFGDSWEIGLVHTDRALPQSIHDLRRYVAGVEDGFSVTVRIVGFTSLDQPKIDLDRMLILSEGPVDRQANKAASTPEGFSDHEHERSAALGAALVKLIERDPSLVKRARLHVAQVLEEQGPAGDGLEEWQDILQNNSVQHLSQFLTSSGKRAEQLLSRSPFWAILSDNERENLLVDAKVTL